MFLGHREFGIQLNKINIPVMYSFHFIIYVNRLFWCGDLFYFENRKIEEQKPAPLNPILELFKTEHYCFYLLAMLGLNVTA